MKRKCSFVSDVFLTEKGKNSWPRSSQSAAASHSQFILSSLHLFLLECEGSGSGGFAIFCWQFFLENNENHPEGGKIKKLRKLCAFTWYQTFFKQVFLYCWLNFRNFSPIQFAFFFFCLSVSSSRISVFSRFQKPSLPWLWINRRCKIDVKFLSYGTSLCTSWIIGPISSKKTREQLYFPLLWRLSVT